LLSREAELGTSTERTPTAEEIFIRHVSELPEGRRILNCIQCGICTGACPHGYAMDFPPRRMLAALRAGQISDVLRSSGIWLCVACYNCSLRCPSKIPLTDRLIASLREEVLIRGGGVPGELQKAFENAGRYGNPFGESPRKRDAWTEKAEVPVPILKKGARADVLWFVECFPSYYANNVPTTQASARILHALGVDFAILGRDEHCAGDTRRLGGEIGLFEQLMEHNLEQLSQRDFDEILVTDPHAYNAFKNEYPLHGGTFQVKHYTQFFEERLPELGKLMKKELDLKVTYHDPCYLGRRNGEYTAPRILLENIPGVKLVEMERIKEDSLCCGGGGGGVWLDSFIWEHTRERLPVLRVQEAARTGADVLAVACPLEISRFQDAIKVAGLEGKLVVKEITDLLAESMGLNGRA
jgi:Fe-S oxidoreductase